MPGLVEIPLLGPALFGQPWPLYVLYPLVPLAWWLVYRTRWGLEVRAVGENPQAADVSSIDVNARRRQAIYLAGITSGLGGGYLLLGQVGWFEDAIVGGQGFIAIAAVVFGGWTLRGAMLGCLLFGSANSFRLSLPAVGHPLNSELLSSLPFVLTICVMALFAHKHPRAAVPGPPVHQGTAMKAVLYDAHGGPEVLRYTDVADPEPGPGDVVVQVEATALNRLDIVQRAGYFTMPGFAFPHISGMDVAGTVATRRRGGRRRRRR